MLRLVTVCGCRAHGSNGLSGAEAFVPASPSSPKRPCVRGPRTGSPANSTFVYWRLLSLPTWAAKPSDALLMSTYFWITEN